MRNKFLNSWIVTFILVCSSYGQPSSDPQEHIAKLLSDFQRTVVSGGSLDQYFGSASRARDKREIDSLQSKSFLKFSIDDYNLSKDLKFVDPKHATLSATVRWETRNEQASRVATLRFEEEGGAWHFSNTGFWEVSVVWVIPLIVLGLAYGCSLAFIYWHSNRQQWLNPKKRTLWQALAVIPFSILFYWSRRPWTS